ncbi:MAG TPA: hypothetical protein VLF59_00070 [Candidatus Saccharimonadales bacterium]|nr:hypothetical protein [Candidatus Saccharimonadales bacterium]
MSTKMATLYDARLTDAAPGTTWLRGQSYPVLRGTLLPEYFRTAEAPEYQRLLMLGGKHDDLRAALDPETGMGIPDDLLLCARTSEYEMLGNGELVIPRTVLYTLDGHQRLGAGKARLEDGQGSLPLGVKIILGTSLPLEVELFYQVNRLHTEVLTHVHLRNAGANSTLRALRVMSEKTPGFPEVQWDQWRNRSALDHISAHMLYEVAVLLHGRALGLKMEGIIAALDELTPEVGTATLAKNVQTFFKVMDQITEGNNLEQFRRRAGMLRGLAMYFGRHQNFWRANKLVVPKTEINSIRSVKWSLFGDALGKSASASGLRDTLANQINRQRTSNKLMPRVWQEAQDA